MSQPDSLRLTNLQILPAVAKRDLPAFLAAADVCLMTVVPVPVQEHDSANKFFDSLSTGKPVVLNYGGWQHEVLKSADAGVGRTMYDEEAYPANLAALHADLARRTAMGHNARKQAQVTDRAPEEMFWLLVTDELPDAASLKEFQADLASRTDVPDFVFDALRGRNRGKSG